MGRARRRFNQLKKVALQVFETRGEWLWPPDWAILARFWPPRASYTYLGRLHRWGLLRRRGPTVRQRGSRRQRYVEYAISQKGRDRLAWLQRR